MSGSTLGICLEKSKEENDDQKALLFEEGCYYMISDGEMAVLGGMLSCVPFDWNWFAVFMLY